MFTAPEVYLAEILVAELRHPWPLGSDTPGCWPQTPLAAESTKYTIKLCNYDYFSCYLMRITLCWHLSVTLWAKNIFMLSAEDIYGDSPGYWGHFPWLSQLHLTLYLTFNVVEWAGTTRFQITWSPCAHCLCYDLSHVWWTDITAPEVYHAEILAAEPRHPWLLGSDTPGCWAQTPLAAESTNYTIKQCNCDYFTCYLMLIKLCSHLSVTPWAKNISMLPV